MKKRGGASIVLAVTFGLAGVLVAPGRASAAPWTVTALSATLTPVQLAQSLVGPGITVNSATFTGDNRAGGTFNDPAASVGLASGIVLSSGNVQDVIGPNDAGNSGVDLGTAGSSSSTPWSRQHHPGRGGTRRQLQPTNVQLAINYVFA
jgi:hypothetical protein